MDYKRVSKDNVLTWPLKASAYTSYSTKMEFLESGTTSETQNRSAAETSS